MRGIEVYAWCFFLPISWKSFALVSFKTCRKRASWWLSKESQCKIWKTVAQRLFFSPIRRTDVFEVCVICLTTLRAQYIARSMNRRHWAFMASLGQVCGPKTSITSIRACFKVWWRFGCVCLMVVWWGGSVLDGWIVVVCFWIGGVLDDILVVVVGSLLSW